MRVETASGERQTAVELEGVLDHIVYCNEENGYTVAKIRMQGRRDPITAVGNLLGVNPGETLKLYGWWMTNPRYGQQFKVERFNPVYPATVEGIRKYLGSGLIKGIGPVMAGRITDRFGIDTLHIIESDRERLSEVPGIGQTRIAMIGRAWEEQREIKEVMLFLQGHGISAAYAVRIYKTYGEDALSIVRHNPYRLAFDIFGIGFKTADRIARQLGLPEDSPERLKAALAHQLRAAADEGHVYLPEDRLATAAAEALEMAVDIMPPQIDALQDDETVFIEDGFQPRRVYLRAFRYAEEGVAWYVRRLTDAAPARDATGRQDVGAHLCVRPIGLPVLRNSAAAEDGQPAPAGRINLSPQQVKAVEASLQKRLLIVTGGPGTGKTTIIKAIIDAHSRSGRNIALCAPTGRAAKRMAEATGHEARTIHRLLEYSPSDRGFKRNEGNPLDADLVIVDEASMIDVILGYHLFKALSPGASIILVGDVDQLPSVGAGNLLCDLINSDTTEVIRLNHIYRQAGGSLIITNAHRINSGLLPRPAGRDDTGDFFFIREEDPEKVLAAVLSLCAERLPQKYLVDPFEHIQVLVPMHRGLVGTINLNSALQDRLNPGGRELVRGGRRFRCGDKVMQMVNNYDKDVYNGDTGRITGIDTVEQLLRLNVDGREVEYDFSELDELSLAYAVSVHKSQGSEYPMIILPLLTQHYMMLQRNLLYTAVTRARRLAVIIGSPRALRIAVNNDKVAERYSGLM
ncbi:MAG: ATP-dependent RecD-like DNA helicase, partial [bacterium]|nr:ATP-dependent RecD-like DNA helicase [bacterium]